MKRFFSLVFISLITTVVLFASQRIVSLAPSITQIVYSLGSKKDLVGCTSYCQVDKNQNTVVVASMIQVNSEKILLLKPTIVLATSITKPSDIETLRKLGVKVVVFNTPKSFTEICSQFEEIGSLIGKNQQATQITKLHQQKVNKLKAIGKKPKPKIFFQIGANPLFTVIPNTFMDDYITFSGGQNLASDLTRGTITRESVVMRNPDVIIIVTMGIVGPEEKTIWESYTNLTAAKNKKIFIVDSEKACVATPQNFSNTLEEIINLIYKK